MITLAIETSTQPGSIALRDASGEVCCRELPDGVRHAQSLIQEIDKLLKSNSLVASDVHRLCVSIGPGSFTGLRVGVTCAKVWAYAQQCELVAVPTFDAVAASCPTDFDAQTRLSVIADAQKSDVYTREYRLVSHEEGKPNWSPQSDHQLRGFLAWREELNDTDLLTGPALKRYANKLSDCDATLLSEYATPHARGLLLAAERHQPIDPFRLTPYYHRKSAAEEQWDARHGTTT